MEYSVYNRKLRWMAAIKGIILILLGIVALANPKAALLTFAVYIGFATLLTGIVIIISAIANNKVEGWGWALVEGLMDVFFGILLVSFPVMTAFLLPIVIGFWIFFGGVLQLVTSIAYRSAIDNWWAGLIYGIIAIVFSIYILYTPILSSIVFVSIIGVFALVFGIYYFISAFTHKKIAY